MVANMKAFRCFEGLKIGRKWPRSRHSSRPLKKEGQERATLESGHKFDGLLVPGGWDL